MQAVGRLCDTEARKGRKGRKERKLAWQSWETAKVEIASLLEQKHGGVVEAADLNKTHSADSPHSSRSSLSPLATRSFPHSPPLIPQISTLEDSLCGLPVLCCRPWRLLRASERSALAQFQRCAYLVLWGRRFGGPARNGSLFSLVRCGSRYCWDMWIGLTLFWMVWWLTLLRGQPFVRAWGALQLELDSSSPISSQPRGTV